MFDINGLRGDMVMAACLRYDLAPIPATFEAKLRLTPEAAADYQDGKTIRVNEAEFCIVKSEPLRNAGGMVQGKYPMSAISITAFPAGCVNVAKPLRRAVIHQNASIAAIYRECGATVGVGGDFIVPRFACFAGSVPTFHIARVLQEESAQMMWRNGRAEVMRLREMLAQAPVDDISGESSEDIRSGFLEADEIPIYVSTNERGEFLMGGRRDTAQTVAYSPRKTAHELSAMSKVLVRRKVVTSQPNQNIRAGEVIAVRGVPLAVMTAAHYVQNDTDGGGANQYSRFWLGSLS